MTRVLVAGGGTAGHVFPAVAVARELRRAAVEPLFVGVDDRLEARLVPAAGFRLHEVEAVAVPRRPSVELLRFPGAVRAARRACEQVIVDEGIEAVITFGGYVSFPASWAAARRGLPLVIHEQNAVPGLANRISGRWAKHIAVTFPGSSAGFRRAERCVVTGNPVREEMLDLDREGRRPSARRQLGLDPDVPTLLVFGGSQGARALNRAIVDAYRQLRELGVQILHAAGRGLYLEATSAWEQVLGEGGSDRVKVVDFIDDMGDAYAAADVVVCRSGATSIAELTVLGLPSVLVPYPHATGDHQRHNAEALARTGGAVVIPDVDLDGASLVAAVLPLVTDPDRWRATADAARAFGRPEAAADVARLVLDELDQDRSRP